jgi:hypothetical protein
VSPNYETEYGEGYDNGYENGREDAFTDLAEKPERLFDYLDPWQYQSFFDAIKAEAMHRGITL